MRRQTVCAWAGDKHERAVEAIHQECLQHLACLPALTAVHTLDIVRDLRRRTWSTLT